MATNGDQFHKMGGYRPPIIPIITFQMIQNSKTTPNHLILIFWMHFVASSTIFRNFMAFDLYPLILFVKIRHSLHLHTPITLPLKHIFECYLHQNCRFDMVYLCTKLGLCTYHRSGGTGVCPASTQVYTGIYMNVILSTFASP